MALHAPLFADLLEPLKKIQYLEKKDGEKYLVKQVVAIFATYLFLFVFSRLALSRLFLCHNVLRHGANINNLAKAQNKKKRYGCAALPIIKAFGNFIAETS